MSKNTSVLLGSHFQELISNKVKSGSYQSASEVVREALRLFEQRESHEERIMKLLEEGVNSGFIEDYDPNEHLRELNARYPD